MAKRKRKLPTEPEVIEKRLERLEQGLSLALSELEYRRATLRDSQAGIAYRSGRWHLRDGDRYDKPPV